MGVWLLCEALERLKNPGEPQSPAHIGVLTRLGHPKGKIPFFTNQKNLQKRLCSPDRAHIFGEDPPCLAPTPRTVSFRSCTFVPSQSQIPAAGIWGRGGFSGDTRQGGTPRACSGARAGSTEPGILCLCRFGIHPHPGRRLLLGNHPRADQPRSLLPLSSSGRGSPPQILGIIQLSLALREITIPDSAETRGSRR